MIKRSIDIVISIVALVVLSPVFFVIACLVWINLGRPVLFHQMRPGLHGKPFRMTKFRSMEIVRESGSRSVPDSDRLTPFGRFLRSTSLDELPELWNVLRGEMSLVGPRPLLMEYLTLYSSNEFRRHEVRPGITGWAQINGRNAQTWDERFSLDVWYVENRSTFLDLKILFITLKDVVKQKNITAPGEATMPKFNGSEKE